MDPLSQETAAELGILSERVVARLIAIPADALEPLESEALKARSIARPPASSIAVELAQRRLGLTLPLDYARFLTVSNGLVLPGFEGHTIRLLGVDEIARFRDMDAEALESWRHNSVVEPFAPLQSMPSEVSTFHHSVPDFNVLESAVAVSEIVASGGVFIVPYPKFGDEAYEVWGLGPWSGCVRYRTFRQFLHEHVGAYLRADGVRSEMGESPRLS